MRYEQFAVRKFIPRVTVENPQPARGVVSKDGEMRAPAVAVARKEYSYDEIEVVETTSLIRRAMSGRRRGRPTDTVRGWTRRPGRWLGRRNAGHCRNDLDVVTVPVAVPIEVLIGAGRYVDAVRIK